MNPFNKLAKIVLFRFGKILAITQPGKKLLEYAKFSIYLRSKGWFQSVAHGKPVDRYNNPVPWITYPCLDFLEKRITKDMNVFEWGSGNSTLWWAKKAATITSCEHSTEWYKTISSTLPKNTNYIFAELEGPEYTNCAKNQNTLFDVIVIDGRDRVECAFKSLESLKNNGIIIWDNSDRKQYKAGYRFLEKNGFKRLDFQGIGPINFLDWCTSIFYRPNNCLDI